jgi:hypothetical protein
MSTKIYNGFAFKDCNTLDDAFSKLKYFRSTLIDAAADMFNAGVVREATYLYDKQIEPKINPHYFSEARTMLDNLIHDYKKLNEHHPMDFTTNVWLAELKHDKKVLGYYSSNTLMEKKFKKLKFFSEYGYWNNTDKPRKITEREWEHRGKDWDAIFGNEFTLDKAMLQFKMIEPNDYVYLNRRPYKPSSIPSDKDRIDHLARFMLDRDEKEGKFSFPTDVFEMLKFMRSDEYKTMLQAKREHIVLKPVNIKILKGF